MPCEFCDDGSGKSVYPYYGVAPHKHDTTRTGSIIGSTVIDPKESWPANFSPDYEEGDDITKPIPGLCGTYTHCQKCSVK